LREFEAARPDGVSPRENASKHALRRMDSNDEQRLEFSRGERPSEDCRSSSWREEANGHNSDIEREQRHRASFPPAEPVVATLGDR